MADYTTDNIPIGIAYDSNGVAKGFFQLSSLDVDLGNFNLSSAADMCDTAPGPGEVLAWDGGKWCHSSLVLPAATFDLSDADDVCNTSPTGPGQVLAWNGSLWCHSSLVIPAGGGGGSFTPSALSAVANDVTYSGTGIATNEILQVKGGVFKNVQPGMFIAEQRIASLSSDNTFTEDNTFEGFVKINDLTAGTILSATSDKKIASVIGDGLVEVNSNTPSFVEISNSAKCFLSGPINEFSVVTTDGVSGASSISGVDGSFLVFKGDDTAPEPFQTTTAARAFLEGTNSPTAHSVVIARDASAISSVSAEDGNVVSFYKDGATVVPSAVYFSSLLDRNAELINISDVSGESAQQDGCLLRYNASLGKWIGAKISGAGIINAIVDPDPGTAFAELDFSRFLSLDESKTGKGDLASGSWLFMSGASSTSVIAKPFYLEYVNDFSGYNFENDDIEEGAVIRWDNTAEKFRIDNLLNLSGLSDVSGANPSATGKVLISNSTHGKWAAGTLDHSQLASTGTVSHATLESLVVGLIGSVNTNTASISTNTTNITNLTTSAIEKTPLIIHRNLGGSVSTVASTSMVSLYQFVIPGGVLTGKDVKVKMFGRLTQNSGGNQTLTTAVYLNGAAKLNSGTTYQNNSNAYSWEAEIDILKTGSAAQQLHYTFRSAAGTAATTGYGNMGSLYKDGMMWGTATETASSDIVFDFRVQWGSSIETANFILDSITVQQIPDGT